MPKPRGAGDLRDRVKFQRRSEADDGYGNVEGDWRDLDIVRWATLAPTRGGEEVQAARVTGKAMWDCWVRWDEETRGLRTGDRMIDLASGATFNIGFAEDMDRRREWILIQATTGVADG